MYIATRRAHLEAREAGFLVFIMYSEVAHSTELAREIGHFKIATFGRLCGILEIRYPTYLTPEPTIMGESSRVFISMGNDASILEENDHTKNITKHQNIDI